MGACQKILTAPSGRDTINTMDSSRGGRKGWYNMTTTLYITRTGDMIQTGKPAEVTLEEYPEISRTWTRRVTVELPAGFEAAEAGDGRKHIFRGSDCYELTANADGVPCIIDHTQRGGPFIPLRVLSEGWGI